MTELRDTRGMKDPIYLSRMCVGILPVIFIYVFSNISLRFPGYSR